MTTSRYLKEFNDHALLLATGIDREEPMTAVGWNARLVSKPQPPGLLTTEEYSNMTSTQQARYDAARFIWHNTFQDATTRPIDRVASQLEALIIRGLMDQSSVASRLVLLTGESHTGKSTLGQRVLRKIDRDIRRVHDWGPPPLPGGPSTRTHAATIQPILYCSARGTVGGTLVNMLRFYDPATPLNSRVSLQQSTLRLINYIHRCSTRVIAFDQLQELDGARVSERQQSEFLKTIQDACPDSVLVGWGNNLRGARFLGDGHPRDLTAQTRRRTDIIDMPTIASVKEMREVLNALEGRLVLLRAKPGDLANYAEPLLKASHGALGNARVLVATAANRAIHSRAERIERDSFQGQL